MQPVLEKGGARGWLRKAAPSALASGVRACVGGGAGCTECMVGGARPTVGGGGGEKSTVAVSAARAARNMEALLPHFQLLTELRQDGAVQWQLAWQSEAASMCASSHHRHKMMLHSKNKTRCERSRVLPRACELRDVLRPVPEVGSAPHFFGPAFRPATAQLL